MIKIKVPVKGEGCSKFALTDFDEYKIPASPQGCEMEGDKLYLLFKDDEEAIKYGLHLGDVEQRMAGKEGYGCSREKIRLIISCINDQADFSAISFPEGS